MTDCYITSFDGTRIATQTVGDGPTIVLANGLGGTLPAWRLQIDHFCARFRFVTWDYRGIYKSAAPSNRARFRVEDHVRDLEAVLAAESVDRAIFIGWSMGNQVLLEAYRRLADRFRAIVLINGPYRRPFDTAFNSKLARRFLPRLIDLAHPVAPFIQPAFQRLVQEERVLDLLKGLGLISRSLDDGVFHALAKEFAGMDFQNYFDVMRALAEHDAADVLPTIKVPTLLIAGMRDFFTPVAVAREMHAAIPGSEILEIPLGTHYTPVEFPDLVNLRIEKFLRDHSL